MKLFYSLHKHSDELGRPFFTPFLAISLPYVTNWLTLHTFLLHDGLILIFRFLVETHSSPSQMSFQPACSVCCTTSCTCSAAAPDTHLSDTICSYTNSTTACNAYMRTSIRIGALYKINLIVAPLIASLLPIKRVSSFNGKPSGSLALESVMRYLSPL